MADQEALLESYLSTREIRLARWRYRQRVADAGKECDDGTGEAVFGETGEEADNAEAAPHCHHEETGTAMWRRTTSLPGPPEAEVTEAELESAEAELEKAKLQFSWFMAGHREWVPSTI